MPSGVSTDAKLVGKVETLIKLGYSPTQIFVNLKSDKPTGSLPSLSWVYKMHKAATQKRPVGRPKATCSHRQRGRPRILSKEDELWLILQIRSKKACFAQQLRHLLFKERGTLISRRTIQRVLADNPAIGRAIPQKRLELTEDLRKRRIAFATFIVERFKKDSPLFDILFSSDETRISIGGPDKLQNAVYYYKPDGLPYREVKVLKDFGGTMFWGAISKSLCSDLIDITEIRTKVDTRRTMHAERYVSLLDTRFKPVALKARQIAKQRHSAATGIKWDQEPILLAQDGATAHTALLIKQYAKKHATWLRILQNAPYSPDMAPIELVWAEIKRQLYEEVNISWREQDEVDAAAREIWTQLTSDVQYVQRVMDHWLSSCKKVIAMNGGYV
jgi:transposase